MYKSSDFTKPVYKTGEIMEILNIRYSTIKVYDNNGTLPIKRTGTGRRAIFREDLLNYLDSKGLLYDDTETADKHDVIYARVSSHEQKQKGNVLSTEDPIFTSVRGQLLNDTAVNQDIKRICKQAGIERFSAHAFRDTFATRCVESGMDPKTLQEILGHTDISMTMNLYAHVMPETKETQMQAVKTHIV